VVLVYQKFGGNGTNIFIGRVSKHHTGQLYQLALLLVATNYRRACKKSSAKEAGVGGLIHPKKS
jgi:hypothetical protein